MKRLTKHRRKTSQRSQTGGLSAVLMLPILLSTLLLGALAIDFVRLAMARTEMQCATDSGARAGAEELLAKPQDAEPVARYFTALNRANGEKVDDVTANTTVTVDVVTASIAQPAVKPSVTVTATVQFRHLWAGLFAGLGSTSTLRVKSKAEVQSGLTSIAANQLFPMAVTKNLWLGSVPYVGMPLTLGINAQEKKTAAWTVPNAKDLDDDMRVALGIDTPEVGESEINSYAVGENIPLQNGITGQMQLATPNSQVGQKLLTTDIVVPVIDGDPAFNQTRPIIGFLVIRVTQIIKSGGPGAPLTLMATVTKGLFQGTFNSGTNGATVDSSLTGINASGVKLVQ